MQADNEPVLDAVHAAFCQSGVGMGIAASTREAVPTHVRAIGCRVSSDCREMTIFVSATQAEPVLKCISDNGAVAAVFTEPSSHRTVQVKGRNAQAAPLQPGDLEIVEAYRTAFAHALLPLGFDEALIRTLLACPPADIIGIRLTPTDAYSQTPGPKAGEPLARGT